MKLYVFIVAPNPTRVRLYLAEKAAAGAEIDVEQITVSLRDGEQRLSEHLKRNPMGKLPVLEFDDGSFLTESSAIIEYLEEIHPQPPMIGTNPRERAQVRELDRLAHDGVLFPAARVVHSTNSPLGLPPSPEMAAHFASILPDALGVLEERLADGRPFLAGDHPTIADCTLQAGFQFARFGKVEIDPAFEQLARWDRDYRQREPACSVLVL
ncbi:MAG: glutathione S-transferase family protein [bacterium]|nr:glutathione S-transferase family protein [bacterium]MCP5070536.1 glutathione S-transferase family protein [bacterium]